MLYEGFNGCFRVAAEALRYLAEKPRPIGGQERFNSEHLHQISSEIIRSLTEGPVRLTADEWERKRASKHGYTTQMSAQDEADARRMAALLKGSENPPDIIEVAQDFESGQWSLILTHMPKEF